MAFATLCTNCKKEVQDTDRFCASCGTPRSPDTSPIDPARRRLDARRQALLQRVANATRGTYEIRGELGSGGMAAVYLARDLRLPRRVAIKVMLPGLDLSEGMIERFEEEARTAARLDHPHIVIIYSVEEVEGLNFFVMKYIDGASLEEILRKHGPLPADAVQLLLVEIASALHYAHGEQVVHRDVKPANVMVDYKGSAIVTDFGISKTANSPVITVTGSLIGTPPYISPEQWRGRRATAASDQYALGVVAFQLLAGRLPFTGDAMELREKHLNDIPPLLSDIRDDCPPFLAAAIARMLEKRPEDRWPSLQHVVTTVSRGSGSIDVEAIKQRLASLVGSAKSETKRTLEVTPISPSPLSTTGGPIVEPRTPPRAEPRAERVVLSPTAHVLHVGDRLAYSAVPQAGDGTPLPGHRVVWSTGHPSIAAVDEAGVVTALAPGQTTITAQADGVTGVASVEVRHLPVARLVIDRAPPTLTLGESIALSATPIAPDGAPLPDRPVTWATSRAATASVSDTGRVHAHAVGTVRLTARCEQQTASVDLAIVERPVATVAIDAPRAPVPAGKRLRLRATARDSLGNVLRPPLVWRSASAGVATVGEDGVLSAVAPGETTITATAGGVSGSITVRVVAPQPGLAARLLAGAGAVRAAARTRVAAVRQALPRTRVRAFTSRLPRSLPRSVAHALTRAVPRWVWWVTVATVALFVVARQLPWEEWRKRNGSDPGIRADTAVLMRVTASATTLAVGDTVALLATMQTASGATTVGPPVLWHSSAGSVVDVDEASGRAIAVGPGVVTIRARAAGFGDSVTLTVNPLPVSAVAITRGFPDRFLVGDSRRLTAVARDSRGRAVPGARFVWQSSDDGVALVDASGLVRGVGTGSATITALAGDASAVIAVRVSLPRLVRLELTLPSATLRVGATSSLSARAIDERGRAAPSPAFTWASSRTEVATVDDAGLVRASAPGSVTITASGGGVSGSTELNVIAATPGGSGYPPPDTTSKGGGVKPPTGWRAVAEDRVRRGVATYVRSLSTRDAARVTELYGSASGADQRNRNALVELMEDESRRLQVSNATVMSMRVEPDSAVVEFQLRLGWRTPFGGNRSQTPAFVAHFRRTGSDRWEMTRCRIVGRPALE